MKKLFLIIFALFFVNISYSASVEVSSTEDKKVLDGLRTMVADGRLTARNVNNINEQVRAYAKELFESAHLDVYTPFIADSPKEWTFLMIASAKGWTSVVNFLIDEVGANVNFRSPDEGFTPLMLAAHCGFMSIAKKLRSSGANPNLIADSGHNALTLAVNSAKICNAEFLEYLQNLDEAEQWLSMEEAVRQPLPEITEEDMDVIVEAPRFVVESNTNLPINDNFAMVKFLLDNGAEVSDENLKFAAGFGTEKYSLLHKKSTEPFMEF